ncbi:MAG: penicillin-binding protein activator [Proteobacteria bacterium]|nr:penicillin-binding protein activator [Pseudomonadota bacterium]
MPRSVLTQNPKSLRVLAVAAIALITCACGPQRNVSDTLQAPDPLVAAKRLLGQGNYGAAAAAFADVARASDASRSVELKAIAALAYQDAGDRESADVLIGELDENAGETAPVVALAKSRSMLQAGFSDDAYAMAVQLEELSLTPYQRGVRARVIGEAALAANDIPAAAQAWISAYRYPYPADQSEFIARSTWRAISRLPQSELARRIATSAPASAGWYSLAQIASRSLFDTPTFIESTDKWTQQYAGHPAAELLEELLERSELVSVRPRRIALFLPFDDTLGIAAKAIRDGFLAAWYADSRIESRPSVEVYSTASGDIVSIYRRAVAEGAEFVVGPLKKSFVAALRKEENLEIGILALNVVDAPSRSGGEPPGLYQFGLTPEDEARQVARRAQAMGSRALIVTPDSAWGQRLMKAYANTWKQLGGVVLAEVSYSDEAESYPDAVKRALNIDLSDARAADLRAKLSIPLHVEPRRRADIDVILLAGYPDNARQLLPQLRYFRAETVPVFATSHVYAGGTDAERDRDLNGLVFGDMPWLFGAADVELFNAIRRSWPAEANNYARLHGFGIDAYRIIPYLAKMRYQQNLRIPGVTGVLWMDYEGIVHRHMTWLRFVDGIATLADESVRRYAR